jgi:hypothetical protein
MTSREERLARNEAVFREVNERIQALQETSSTDPEEEIDFLCECGNEECTETVQMTLAEYEDVRNDATQFVVLPGHETPEVERVTDANARFRVVRKHPGEAAIAKEMNRRL